MEAPRSGRVYPYDVCTRRCRLEDWARTPGLKQKKKGCKKEHNKSGHPGQEPREFEFEPLWAQSKKQDGAKF